MPPPPPQSAPSLARQKRLSSPSDPNHTNQLPSSASASSGAASFTPVISNPKRKRRLVPDSERKRIAVSCDRCRTRKLKCQIPAFSTDNNSTNSSSASGFNSSSDGCTSGSSSHPACAQCLKAGVACTRTMPRKQRVYGSVDSLSSHYQTLIHLLSHLYPDHDIKTLDGLKSLAAKLQISLPEYFDPDAVSQSSFLAPPMTVSAAKIEKPSTEHTESLTELKIEDTSNDHEKPISKQSLSLSTYNPFYKTPSTSLFTSPPSQVSSSVGPNLHLNPTELGCERIIYDRSGLPHYVGAIGSMAFFDGVCKIIRRSKMFSGFPYTGDETKAPIQPSSSSSSSSSTASPLLNHQFNSAAKNRQLVSLNVFPKNNNPQEPHHLTTYYGKPASSSNHSPKDIYFCTISSATFAPVLQFGNNGSASDLSERLVHISNEPLASHVNLNLSSTVRKQLPQPSLRSHIPSSTVPSSPHHNPTALPSTSHPSATTFSTTNGFLSNNPTLPQGATMGNNTQTTNSSAKLQVQDTLWDLEHNGPLLSREEADKLVDSYFEHVHPIYTLFSMKAFRKQYAACWDTISSSRNTKISVDDLDLTLDWRCVLYMVFVMGASALIHDEKSYAHYSTFAKYSAFLQKSLFLLIATPSIHTIQALILFTIYLYSINERNIAWLITGIACRLSIAMGLHRESTTKTYDRSEIQVRKLVWWALYSLELHLSANLGRPSTMRDEEIDISIPDPDPELDLYYPPGGFKETIRMVQLLNMTIHQQAINISTSSGMSYNAQLLLHENMEKSIALCRRIKDSLGRLPKHLRELQSNETDLHVRSIMNIHMNCHYCISIVARPYILYLIGSDPSTLTIQQRTDLILLLNIGCAATTAIASILNTLNKRKLVSGVVYYDVYHGYCAIMVLSLASLIIASNKFTEKELAYDLPTIYNAINTIATIMDSLYLDGTSLRLAKVSAYILRDLGVDYKSLNRRKSQATESEEHLQQQPTDIDSTFESVSANRVDPVEAGLADAAIAVPSLPVAASTASAAPAAAAPDQIPITESLGPITSLFPTLSSQVAGTVPSDTSNAAAAAAATAVSATASTTDDATAAAVAAVANAAAPDTSLFDFHSFFTADDYERMFSSRDSLKNNRPESSATSVGSAPVPIPPAFADTADMLASASTIMPSPITSNSSVSPPMSSPNIAYLGSNTFSSNSTSSPLSLDQPELFDSTLFASQQQQLQQQQAQQQQQLVQNRRKKQRKTYYQPNSASFVEPENGASISSTLNNIAAQTAPLASNASTAAAFAESCNSNIDAGFVEALNTFSCTIDSFVNPSRYTTSFKIGGKTANDGQKKQVGGPGTLSEVAATGLTFAESDDFSRQPHQQILDAEDGVIDVATMGTSTGQSASISSTDNVSPASQGQNNETGLSTRQNHQFAQPPSPSPLISHLQARLGLQQPYQWISGANLLEPFYDMDTRAAPKATNTSIASNTTTSAVAPGIPSAATTNGSNTQVLPTQQVMLGYDFALQNAPNPTSSGIVNVSGNAMQVMDSLPIYGQKQVVDTNTTSNLPAATAGLYGLDGVVCDGTEGSENNGTTQSSSSLGSSNAMFAHNGGVGVISSISSWAGAPDHGKNLINYVRQKLK